MSSSTSFQDFIGNNYPRRLLLHNLLHQLPTTAPAPASENSGNYNFDIHIIFILSGLTCALICSLLLNSIIRCALRSSSFVAFLSGGNPPDKLVINTGIKQKALRTFPIVKYTPELELPGLGTECVICLSEFALGECVRLLPKCNHGFHVKCIDKWLRSHSSCPTCRHNLIEKGRKIVDCSQASSSELPPPVQESIVNIVPLEPEGLIRNYRAIS